MIPLIFWQNGYDTLNEVFVLLGLLIRKEKNEDEKEE